MASKPSATEQQPEGASAVATRAKEQTNMVLYVTNCNRVAMNLIFTYLMDMYSTWPGFVSIYHGPRLPFVVLVEFDSDDNVRRAQQGTDGIHVQGCKLATTVAHKWEFPSVFYGNN